MVVAALVGAALGFVVAGTPREHRATATPHGVLEVSMPGFALTLGQQWSRARGVRVPPDAVVLEGPSAELTAARGAIDDPTLLPAVLVRRLQARPGFGRIDRPGAVAAASYPLLALSDGRTEFAAVAVPTTRGAIVLACWAGPTGNAASAAEDCDDALAGLRVTEGRALRPSPDLAFRAALPGGVEQLAAARGRGRARIADASTPTGRAAAAAALAREVRRTTDGLRQRSGDTAPERATLAALTALADAYDRLAGVSGAGDRRRYSRAVARVERAEGAVDEQLAVWRRSLIG